MHRPDSHVLLEIRPHSEQSQSCDIVGSASKRPAISSKMKIVVDYHLPVLEIINITTLIMQLFNPNTVFNFITQIKSANIVTL